MTAFWHHKQCKTFYIVFVEVIILHIWLYLRRNTFFFRHCVRPFVLVRAHHSILVKLCGSDMFSLLVKNCVICLAFTFAFGEDMGPDIATGEHGVWYLHG